jgi:hypothetical protein
MERESTGMKYMAANCEGSQSPPKGCCRAEKEEEEERLETFHPLICIKQKMMPEDVRTNQFSQ